MPSHEATPTPGERSQAQDPPAPTPLHPPMFVEDLPQSRPYTNLARGIVWADILADIEADEKLRQTRDMRDAA